jgi:hypothetical protein
MRLATLLQEIESSPGPVTGIELAGRLGVPAGEVAAMLGALRAAGKIGGESRKPMDSCSSGGACSMTCPGPDECALVINLDTANLEIRSAKPSWGSSVAETHSVLGRQN